MIEIIAYRKWVKLIFSLFNSINIIQQENLPIFVFDSFQPLSITSKILIRKNMPNSSGLRQVQGSH